MIYWRCTKRRQIESKKPHTQKSIIILVYVRNIHCVVSIEMWVDVNGQIPPDPTSWKPAQNLVFDQVSNLLDPVEFGHSIIRSCCKRIIHNDNTLCAAHNHWDTNVSRHRRPTQRGRSYSSATVRPVTCNEIKTQKTIPAISYVRGIANYVRDRSRWTRGCIESTIHSTLILSPINFFFQKSR